MIEVKIPDASGRALNAKVEVGGAEIVLHSRSGKLRNRDYRPALESILARLSLAGIKPNVYLDSERVQHRPLADRRLAGPSQLVGSIEEQFNFLIRQSNAEGPGRGAYKRLLIRVSPMPDDALKAILEGGDAGRRASPSMVNEPPAADAPRENKLEGERLAIPLTDEEQSWVEGNVKIAIHLRRERSGRLPKKFKADFRASHGSLRCQRCDRDSVDVYGPEVAEACFEVHHKVLVSMMTPGHETTTDQLQLLCANCHRAIHREMARG
jgi:hypothetical protein